MSFAKQLTSAYFPLSAAVIHGDMYDAMVDPSSEIGVFGHGYTYSGHPVGCAIALKVLEICQRDQIYSQAAETGNYMQNRLSAVFSEHPLVGEVRGKGMIAAIELSANKDQRLPFNDGRVGAYAAMRCQENGLIVRAVAGNSIALCPPLISTQAQIDDIISKLEKSLNETLDYTVKEGLFV